MLGLDAPFDYIHNFWSDQYEHTLQDVGHATRWDDFAVRGSLAEGKFVGFYLFAGAVRAAVGFDRDGDPEYEPDSKMAACARLVAQRVQPDRGLLTDDHAACSRRRTDSLSLAAARPPTAGGGSGAHGSWCWRRGERQHGDRLDMTRGHTTAT